MTTVAIPARLDWLRAHEAGRDGLAALPGGLAECAEQWSLSIGQPYAYSYVSLVCPVTRGDGTPAVLKLQFPEPDSVHEAAALRAWDGAGAVRLLAHDQQRSALLMEQCRPGTPLSTVDAEAALSVFIDLMPRLWRPAAGPFAAGAAVAERWVEELPQRWLAAGRPCERRLLEAAVAALRQLSSSQGEQVLLNQDLHVNNVLRAEREPWLVIDPKPLLGERELAVAALVRDYGLGHGRREVWHRLDRLCAELVLNRERA